MNRYAYRTTGLAIKALATFSRARLNVWGEDRIPKGPIIFVLNHFTRVETILMPWQINRITGTPVWSLASSDLFIGKLGEFLDSVGAVSTKDPHRDKLIVKSLLSGVASWIIFPEGRMVKSKKIVEKGRFMISYAGGKHPPHTGAATLALRTEFYRRRIFRMKESNPEEARRLLDLFDLDSVDQVSGHPTVIVPVNLTYYPVRARENILSRIADKMVNGLPERALEELMTEGSMLLSGIDIDIRFGAPISVDQCLECAVIKRDIDSKISFGLDDTLPSRKRMKREALRIMQQYMTDIYSMTTVNHDHLFASLLKHAPVNGIHIENLKKRAFLTATKAVGKPGVNPHGSLKENQIHLITDDRFNKFNEFFAFAREKGVIDIDRSGYKKNNARLASLFDFHRARIDNPVGVIANEVEPLKTLQKEISHLSWRPGFWLKRKVAQQILKKAESDFENDYKQFFREDETKPKAIGKPFLLKGRGRHTGIVLTHGYMAAPEEVRGLAGYLVQKGFWVYGVRLPGHGTSPEDLAGRSYAEWIQAVEEGYGIVSNICRQVIVGGFSTGAGLSLELASRIGAIKGVFAVSTPLRLQDFAAKFAPAVSMWNRLMDTVKIEDAKKEFVENHPENPHINYSRNPVSGVRELERLMDALEPRLENIKMPSLVVQSQQDPVVNPKSAEQIFKHLGSEDKQLIFFNFNRHGILLGEGAEMVYRAIGNFIEHL